MSFLSHYVPERTTASLPLLFPHLSSPLIRDYHDNDDDDLLIHRHRFGRLPAASGCTQERPSRTTRTATTGGRGATQITPLRREREGSVVQELRWGGRKGGEGDALPLSLLKRRAS